MEKLLKEIKDSLFYINETVVYYQDDRFVTNSVAKELRKIHRRVDKIETAINKATK